MKLVELYTSEMNVDTILFSIFFVFYAMTSALLIKGLIKLSKQYISRLRFMTGLIVLYAGGAAGFEIVMKYLPLIGPDVSGPGAGFLLIFMGIAAFITVVFTFIEKFIFQFKQILNPTMLFIAAQPILCMLFIFIITLLSKLQIVGF
ncbi:hypothetical protein M3231_01870 [Neobacillus mesonae]|nr:hypothetical protein [Neobacillus mesonae]